MDVFYLLFWYLILQDLLSPNVVVTFKNLVSSLLGQVPPFFIVYPLTICIFVLTSSIPRGVFYLLQFYWFVLDLISFLGFAKVFWFFRGFSHVYYIIIPDPELFSNFSCFSTVFSISLQLTWASEWAQHFTFHMWHGVSRTPSDRINAHSSNPMASFNSK